MGTWTAAFYTPEQQQRLGVDERGGAIQPATTTSAEAEWTCSDCTYSANAPGTDECAMCNTPRNPGSAAVAPDSHRMTLKQRARVVLLGVKLFRGALNQREADAAADDEDGWARYEEEVVGGGGAAAGGAGRSRRHPAPHRGDGAERDAAKKKAAKKKARAKKKKQKKHRRAAGGAAASGGAGGEGGGGAGGRRLEPLRHKARGPVGGLLREERLVGRAVDLRQPSYSVDTGADGDYDDNYDDY